MSIHVVTGGTGFIGSALILELLRQTDVEIICIVRPGEQSAEERLHTALEQAAHAYNAEERLLQEAKKRCHVLPGDVTASRCGITGSFPRHVAQFWHCAASLKHEDRHQTENYVTNLGGTQHALELARSLDIAEYFNYVSTAYVAGKRTGFIPEQLMTEKGTTNNHYEASKVAAEVAVACVKEFPTRIMRPSVVIGHSRTFAVASGFSGIYGFLRKLLRFKEAMSHAQEGLLSRETIHMRVDPEAWLNLVPIDLVVQQAVQIAYSSSQETCFHLTNATPPTASIFLFTLFEEVGIKQPRLVESREQFSWIDKQLDQSIAHYSPYLVGSKLFDRKHTDAAVTPLLGDCPLDEATLRSYFRWYLDWLADNRPDLLAIQ